jgi:hypothetical protein
MLWQNWHAGASTADTRARETHPEQATGKTFKVEMKTFDRPINRSAIFALMARRALAPIGQQLDYLQDASRQELRRRRAGAAGIVKRALQSSLRTGA